MTTSRTRAWRRAQHARHGRPSRSRSFEEKRWKLLYLRSVKLARAKQLRKIWPLCEWNKLMKDAEPTKVLFICSRNQWRSPTAERVWRKVTGIDARSAGTSRNAKRKVKVADIRWADLIFVMEHKHLERMRAEFRQELAYKSVHVLDIPDEYHFMDPELVDIVREKTEPLILSFESGE